MVGSLGFGVDSQTDRRAQTRGRHVKVMRHARFEEGKVRAQDPLARRVAVTVAEYDQIAQAKATGFQDGIEPGG
jgi:ADP-ribose pyrophosphatase YjhB (NUDIX family)